MKNASLQRGVTIFELMVTLIVAAILLSIAVPSFSNLFDKNRVKGAAEELSAQIQFARSQAIARNSDVVVDVMVDGDDWCVGLDEDLSDDCDCVDTPAQCTIDGVQRVTESAKFNGVTLPTGDADITFEGTRGLPVGGGTTTFGLQSSEGKRIGLAVNPIGRVALCSPSGAQNLWEYPTCP